MVKLAPFYEMVRRWDGEAVFKSDGEFLLARCRRSRPKFPLLEADHFRRILCPEEAKAFTLTKDELEHLLFQATGRLQAERVQAVSFRRLPADL